MDLPCTLYTLSLAPMPNVQQAEIDVWRVEVDVAAPLPEPVGQAAGNDA
jgi:hypothetical protein